MAKRNKPIRHIRFRCARRVRRVVRQRQRRGRRAAARGGAVAVPELRALGHHVTRAARCARWVEARAAPHPVHDVAAGADRRRQTPQVREGGRRRDGQLPPARRRGHLRDARAHGAVVFAALPARRRIGQLRIARRRSGRGDALHRVPPHAHQRRAARRDRAGHGALPPELRRHEDRARRAAGAPAEPADQRRDRHRRRHGDQHSAAQPRRSLHGAHQAARERRARQRAAVALYQGPGLSDGRPDSQLAGRDQGDLQDRQRQHQAARHVGHRRGIEIDQDDPHRQHPVHRRQVAAGDADRRGDREAQAAAAARREGRLDRRRAHRHRDEEGRRREDGDGVPLQAHGAADYLSR